MPKKNKSKWRKNYDKHHKDISDSKESKEPLEQTQEEKENPSPSQGACGASADEKQDDLHRKEDKRGRLGRKDEARKGRNQAKRDKRLVPGEQQEGTLSGSSSQSQRGDGAVNEPDERQGKDNHFNKQTKQGNRGRGRGASLGRENDQVKTSRGRGKPPDRTNQDQRPRRPGPMNKNPVLPTQPNTQLTVQGVIPADTALLNTKTLKEKDSKEVLDTLNKEMPLLKSLLQSKEQQHNSEEFIYDLICILARACEAPSGENTNKILAALKGSVFLTLKIPCFLDRVDASEIWNDQVSLQRLMECLIAVFVKYLTHLPRSYADLPYEQLSLALSKSSFETKEDLQKELKAIKEARDGIIKSERRKREKRSIKRDEEKPPNDFRDIPICPTSEEITTQEIPFLRKNISKGRYENVEHYLDVQFRLLREDFLEPLKEGIQEIGQNLPKSQRKQLTMKTFRGVRIVSKKFTWSGITHQIQIDVSGLDTKRWSDSKLLLYGSFLCLSNDNFKKMFFATVSKRDPEELKNGIIDIQFIEDQDVSGIERRNYVYQMVESPAYFEAYRHVLKGLKKLNEATMPFKKYLVECNAEVDPPEYLRREESEEPVCYDLSEALDIVDKTNATAVPVLVPGAWPSVEALPLNSSQLEALRTAITTEFSVIQGPPGTGKTYVGAKIVRCLLRNRRKWDPARTSPMLMVCFTNHALDQFLEKVLEFLPKKEIIRVGGRCKSPMLEGCNLKNFSKEYRLDLRRKEVRKMIQQNENDRKEWKTYITKAENELLELNDLEDLLNPEHVDQFYKATFPSDVKNVCRSPGNTFKLWLCCNKQMQFWNESAAEITKDLPGDVLGAPAFHETGANKHVADPPSFIASQEDEESITRGRQVSAAALFPFKEKSFVSVDPWAQLNSHKISSEMTEFIDNNSASGKENFGEKAGEVNEGGEGIITSERETALIQYQRCLLGEEDLFNLTIGENDDLESQEKDPTGAYEEDSEHWITVSYGRRGNLLDNMKTGIESSKANPDASGKKNCGEKAGEVNEGHEETITIEREADLIQYQRCLLGEEDLFNLIVGENDDPEIQEQDPTGAYDEDNEGWITVSYGRRGNVLDHMKTGSESSREKPGASQAYIRGDISQLRDKLGKEKMMSSAEAMKVSNIWNLSESERLRLYLFWIDSYRDRYRAEFQKSEQAYEELCEELQDVRFREEEVVLRQATVVGMTTTGAARYHSVLQRIAPRIVVIEEAAEVMESHIITSLSHNTKHTILIGDHKQLRPKATVYELAQRYNLEVSLFERMVMNNVECKQLSTQHRMRPEIAALIKIIYDHEIKDHESVFQFEDISGVCRNLFFIDHCHHEIQEPGLQSYSNTHEASFLVALCNYLLLQGYNKGQITILTMYVGQLLHIKNIMARHAFSGVRICVVDNFQGEENEIILLSLVRSNSVGSIGFLRESNRICVALSRARKGLYCIGNFGLLKSKSKLWKAICDDLETKGAIGHSLQLVCKRHNNITSVQNSRQFNALGGCNMPCGDRLDCGHACGLPCHTKSHSKNCSKRCVNRCSNEHQCKQSCHYPSKCFPCLQQMPKTVPRCGHEQLVPCSTDPEMFSCLAKCEQVLPCGHPCDKPCGQLCTRWCQVKCTKSLKCGHEKSMPCYKEPTIDQCARTCTKLLACGHPCSKKCKQECQCNTKIEVQLPCKHWTHVLCCEKDSSIRCTEKCERVLTCGHYCPGICHEDCRSKRCKIVVVKDLPCGHEQSMPCFQDPKDAICLAPCHRQLNCGHRCSSLCGRPCHDVQCEELCQRNCQRGHPCQNRCHFGSPCDNCTVEVNITLSKCGHDINKPCYVEPASLTCIKPCARVRVCGHPCKEICDKNCEVRPCKEPVTRILSCNHTVNLPCHKDPMKFVCKEKVEVHLSCGHKTFVECRVEKAGLQHVLCKESMEKKLPCNHTISLPCFKNPKDCICRRNVEFKLPCGHKKSAKCSTVSGGLTNQFCEVRPCKKPVTRILSCNHAVNLPCHKDPEKFVCKEKVEVLLSCGHKTFVECRVEKAGLRNVLCKESMKKKLPCNHTISLPCFKNPEDCICRTNVELKLSCGHKKSAQCFSLSGVLTNQFCTVKISRTLACGHETTLPCHINPDEYNCLEVVEILLDCGHNKRIICSSVRSELQGGVCNTNVKKNLPCGHEKLVNCSDKPEEVFCDAPCERILSCDHRCPGKCGEQCDNLKCIVKVRKDLSCGNHRITCLCSKDVSQLVCSNPCIRTLKCGHQCRGKCFEKCSQYQCQEMVVKKLSCKGNHSLKMPCQDDPKSVTCQDYCKQKLACGHPCPGNCSQPCETLKCKHKVEKTFPCGHKEHLQCFQTKTATCRAPCPRREKCKHLCEGICGQPCSKYPCKVEVRKTLSCGHHKIMRCSDPIDEVQCSSPCRQKLKCGHYCSGICNECNQRGSHEICQNPCAQRLVCFHLCQAKCIEPCPPCNKKCGRRCPHTRCTRSCSQSCEPCRQPCKWICDHYQCNNLCGEECNRPRCDAPCPKKLPCRHPCIGLCGENCPTVCAICNAKKLSSMASNTTETTRYLQLIDCGHIVEVEEMDRWMQRDLGSDVQLIRCPRCSVAITFSYRYGNLIKETLRNIDKGKARINDLLREASEFSSGHKDSLKQFQQKLQMMKHPRKTSLIFALKNHLLVIDEVKKAQACLKHVKSHQASSQQQFLVLKQYSSSIRDALKKMTEYLQKPQLDLSILNNVYEQARKFSLFASILEAQNKAINSNRSFSDVGVSRLKLAQEKFSLFLQGNNDALHTDWLERIVALLRKEMGLPSLAPEEPKEFENFPGFNKGAWKLCEHRQVYFSRMVMCNGEIVTKVSTGCRRCIGMEDSNTYTEQEEEVNDSEEVEGQEELEEEEEDEEAGVISWLAIALGHKRNRKSKKRKIFRPSQQ